MLLLDQVAKYAVQAKMALYDSVTVIGGFFNLTYTLNPGAAFGMFAEFSPQFRLYFFITLTLIICGLIVYLIKKEYAFRVRSFAYTMIIAGAIGNAIDRVRIGMVVDFLDVYFKQWHWYTFNLADSWITVGVALVFISMFVEKPLLAEKPIKNI